MHYIALFLGRPQLWGANADSVPGSDASCREMLVSPSSQHTQLFLSQHIGLISAVGKRAIQMHFKTLSSA